MFEILLILISGINFLLIVLGFNFVTKEIKDLEASIAVVANLVDDLREKRRKEKER